MYSDFIDIDYINVALTLQNENYVHLVIFDFLFDHYLYIFFK